MGLFEARLTKYSVHPSARCLHLRVLVGLTDEKVLVMRIGKDNGPCFTYTAGFGVNGQRLVGSLRGAQSTC